MLTKNQWQMIVFIGAFVAVFQVIASYLVPDMSLVGSVSLAMTTAVIGGLIGYYLYM